MSIKKILSHSEELFSKDRKNIHKQDISSLEDKCKRCLSEINRKIELCVNAFNNMALEISKIMKTILPKDNEAKLYYNFFKQLVKAKPLEPISLFIDKVYSIDEYRLSIKNGNDEFFLDNNHENVIGDDKNKINKMFKFKSCWKELDGEVKHSIKEMMKTLINLTAKYIEELDNGNQIADIMKIIAMKY